MRAVPTAVRTARPGRAAIAALGAVLAAAAVAGCPGPVPAEETSGTTETALVGRYVGGWDVEGLLSEPAIAAELEALTGNALAELERNLDVNAGVEYYGSALAVSGNAPHRGGEEEAIVCIQPTAPPKVHAGIHSRGRITVYTREARYEFLPTCVKDWITQVNSGHADRMRAPANVHLVRP